MESTCRKLAYYLCKKKYASMSDVEDSRFLLELLITQIITIISIYIIGLLFMNVYSIAIICVIFILGRIYLDGYHASTFIRCYALTILNFIFSNSMLYCENRNILFRRSHILDIYAD